MPSQDYRADFTHTHQASDRHRAHLQLGLLLREPGLGFDCFPLQLIEGLLQHLTCLLRPDQVVLSLHQPLWTRQGSVVMMSRVPHCLLQR